MVCDQSSATDPYWGLYVFQVVRFWSELLCSIDCVYRCACSNKSLSGTMLSLTKMRCNMFFLLVFLLSVNVKSSDAGLADSWISFVKESRTIFYTCINNVSHVFLTRLFINDNNGIILYAIYCFQMWESIVRVYVGRRDVHQKANNNTGKLFENYKHNFHSRVRKVYLAAWNRAAWNYSIGLPHRTWFH